MRPVERVVGEGVAQALFQVGKVERWYQSNLRDLFQGFPETLKTGGCPDVVGCSESLLDTEPSHRSLENSGDEFTAEVCHQVLGRPERGGRAPEQPSHRRTTRFASEGHPGKRQARERVENRSEAESLRAEKGLNLGDVHHPHV